MKAAPPNNVQNAGSKTAGPRESVESGPSTRASHLEANASAGGAIVKAALLCLMP